MAQNIEAQNIEAQNVEAQSVEAQSRGVKCRVKSKTGALYLLQTYAK